MSNRFIFGAELSEIQQWGEIWRMELGTLEQEVFRLAELPLDQRLKALQQTCRHSSGIVFNCYPNFEKLAPKIAEWVDSNMRTSPDIFGQTVVAVKTALDDLFVAPTPDLSALEQSVVAARQAVHVVLERALKPKLAMETPSSGSELSRDGEDLLLLLYSDSAFNESDAQSTGQIVCNSRGKFRSARSRPLKRAKDELKAGALALAIPGLNGGIYLTEAGKNLATEILRNRTRAKRARS
jgi:hypothetical protein